MTKAEIRKEILRSRDSLGDEERAVSSKAIAGRLYELEEYREASNIFMYASFRSEVDTYNIIARALSEGRAVALPRCTGEDTMVFCYIESLSDLKSGYRGIPEPGEDLPAALSEPDLMIVPGVAFDPQMNRVGYGKGFYDRFFKAIPLYVPKIALAFELQMVPEIPYETLDETMDKIITEKGIYERSGDDFTI